MNRFTLQQTIDGVRASLKDATNKLAEMYADSSASMEARTEQQKLVKDLEEREAGLKAQLDKMDAEAKAKMEAQNVKNANVGSSKEEKILNAKAEIVRATMKNRAVSQEVLNALGDGSTLGNGDKILPSTMTNELLYEPLATNPLRSISTFTNITNLEVPKITFSLDDDDFITDGETAKELAASTDTIVFTRNKFKVFCDITETVLNGTNTNLMAVVNAGLQSGLAKKEKKVAFAPAESATEMSFYHQTGSKYDIKEVEGASLFEAIVNALADLEDDYAANAKVVMKKADYYSIITSLANNSTALYAAQPEQVIGAPVIFCDMATIPVVGDFKYSHFNYDLNMLYDTDKNVKTGLNSFVLTAWIDHKIKMKSAFRLTKVTP